MKVEVRPADTKEGRKEGERNTLTAQEIIQCAGGASAAAAAAAAAAPRGVFFFRQLVAVFFAAEMWRFALVLSVCAGR